MKKTLMALGAAAALTVSAAAIPAPAYAQRGVAAGVAAGLLGGAIIFLIFGQHAYEALLGFGFGGTLLALFMRVGGGIFTKAADVGADV